MCFDDLLCGAKQFSVDLRQADISHTDTRRTLTEEGDWDLNILISRDILKEWAQNEVKRKTRSTATVMHW